MLMLIMKTTDLMTNSELQQRRDKAADAVNNSPVPVLHK